MNTKTQVLLGFYSHSFDCNFSNNLFRKLKMLFVFTISISNLFAFNELALFNCNDTIRPVIKIDIGNCNPANRDSNTHICYGFLSLNASATDDQTGGDDLIFEYKIDLNNDGVGAYGGFDCWVGELSKNQMKLGITPLHAINPFANNITPFDASGTYPIGIHKICWNVKDSCDNVSSLCQLFEIKDCKAPTPYCLTGVITVPLPSSGSITIWAKDLDKGSFDNCTNDTNLKFYFNEDPSATSMTITCKDFQAAGGNDELIVDVQMWVEDEEGNTDYCKTVIIVQDNQNICGDGLLGQISGRVFSIRNRKDTLPINNFQLILGLIPPGKNVQLIQKGDSFFIKNLPVGDCSLTLEKNDQPFDSVSTYDLILSDERILGINAFKDIYQSYCADVNRSSSMTAADISEIRKLILRNVDGFSKSNSWLIYPIIDPPPMFPITTIDINLKPGENRKIDFRAVKIGDVYDLVGSDSDKLLIPNPSDSLQFNIVNSSIKAGDSITVDFYSKNFTNILGYQFTIKFDTEYLSFNYIIQNNLSTSYKANFGARFLTDGFITTSWYDRGSLSYQSYKNNEILFTFKFLAIKDGTLCDLISITSDLTPAEAYRDSFILHNINLDVCDVVIKTKEEIKDFCTVYPNPFRNEINFHFSEVVNFPVQIEIYSLEGKKLSLKKLENEVKDWKWAGGLMDAGVYFIIIRDNKNKVYLKMIKD